MNWDSRVDNAIQQSSQGLRQVSKEYKSHIIDEYNMRRQESVSSSSSSRYSSAYQPQHTDDGTIIFRDVLNNIENQTPCGPHQRAALKAFHATTRRPLSRGRSSNIDRHIEEKLKSSSLAIDALRDQLVALSDEVRQLKRTKQLQEKRIDGLVDIVHSMDNAQSEIAAKERQNMMVEINTLMDRQQQQISQSTQAYQRNLVDTLQQAVKEESAQTEKKCLDAIEKIKDDKGYVKLITKIVTEASVEIESKLRAVMSSKLENLLAEKRQHDTTLISRQVKEIMGSDLADIRKLLKQTAMKQSSFIDTDKAEAMIQSCTSTLEEKVMDMLSTNNKDKDDALQSIEASLLKHKSAMKQELDKISQTIITKQVADAIVTDRCDYVFDRCMKVINDSTTQFDNKMSAISSKLQACATSEDVIHLAHQQSALGESSTSSMEVVDGLGTRLDELEHSFRNKMSTMLDVVESCNEKSRQLGLKLADREVVEQQLTQSNEMESKIATLQQNRVDESVLQKSSSPPVLESTIAANNCNAIQQSSLATPIKSSDDRPRELILSPDLSPKFNSFLDFISKPSADKSLTSLSSRPQQSPSSSRAPSTNTNDTTNSEDKSGQLYEVPSSDGSSSNDSGSDTNEEDQQSLTLERNRALSSLARTLSSVAIKNDDQSLMEMATDIRAGKREEPSNTEDTRDGENVKGSPSSAAEESNDTATALSLCGVQLDQSSSRSDSPPTSVDDNSIDTADAISLCGGIQGQYEEEKETQNTVDKPRNDNKTSDGEKEESSDDIEHETTSSASGNTSTSLDSLNTTSSSSDEDVSKKRSENSQYNPTRLSNPDPYQGWDTLLLELQASGKILRDGSSDSSSYSSNFSADE